MQAMLGYLEFLSLFVVPPVVVLAVVTQLRAETDGVAVLAVQWGLGARQLWRRRRFLAVGVAVPTLYLATIDRVALSFDVWQLSDRLTSGVTIVGLPVEEGAFFLLTSAFVAKGVVLYQHGRERLYRRFVETE
jgi:lycopene cyclase domain-containing protein